MTRVANVDTVAKAITEEVVIPFANMLLGTEGDSEPHHGDFATKLALVKRMRKTDASWKDVGVALGTTRQAAWERFHKQVDG